MPGWLQDQAAARKPQPIAPPPLQAPPSTVIAQPNGPLPPMPKMNAVGATQPPVPAPIPGMEKIGPLPGVPPPPNPMRPPMAIPPPRRIQDVQIHTNEIAAPTSAVINLRRSGPVPPVIEGPAQTLSEGIGQAADYTAGQIPKTLGAVSKMGAFTRPGQSQVSDADVVAAAGTVREPLVRPELLVPDDGREDLTREVVRGALEAVGGLTSPETIAVISATGGLGRAAQTATSPQAAAALKSATTALSLYFTGQAAKSGYDAGKTAMELYDKGDAEGAARYLGVAGVDALFAVLGTAHATSQAIGGAKSFKKGYGRGQRRREAVSADAEARFEAAQQRLNSETMEPIPGEPGKFRVKRDNVSPENSMVSPVENQQVTETSPEIPRNPQKSPAADPIQQIIEAAPPIEAKPVVPPAPPVAPAESPLAPPPQEEAVQPLPSPPAVLDGSIESSEPSVSPEVVKQPLSSQASAAPSAEPNLSQVPAPGPREEVVQPESVDAAAPVATTVRPSYPVITGRRAPAKTSRGYKVDTNFAVVPMKALRISNSDGGEINPDYPRELQPRQRDRKSSDEQIQTIVEKFDPDQLAENYLATDGAPIVGEDMAVESGNGRSMAIRRIYGMHADKAAMYRNWMIENADRFGLDAEAISGVEDPVLVRVRKSLPEGVDRATFGRDANERTTQGMSPAELSAIDAKGLDSNLISLFVPEGGDINSTANAQFVNAFIEKLVPVSERNTMRTGDDHLSTGGMRRIQNAIFAKAYEDRGMIERMAEDPDDNIRSVVGGMVSAAPRFISIKSAIENGDLHPLDISKDLTAAASTLSNLRAEGKQINDYLGQMDMYGRPAIQDAILSTLRDLGKSKSRFGDLLNQYADAVEAVGSPKQAGMFGPTEVPSPLAIWASIVEREQLNARGTQANAAPGRVDAGNPRVGNGSSAGTPAKSGRPEVQGKTGPVAPAAVAKRGGNTVEQTPSGPQETLVTDIEARESQIAAKNDRNRPLAEVPFSLIQERAPADPGPPDDRQSSMFDEPESDSEVAGFRPGKARPAPPPRAPGKTGTMVSRSEIVSDLSRFLSDIPIRTGGFREKAAGIFKIRQEVIRSKKPLDLPTIAHEIGHAIHKYLWGVTVNKKNLNSRPLTPFRHELGALDYDPNLSRPFEGFAEYIRLRLTEPATAAKRAPKFHAWFEKQLGMHPDLAKVLDQAQKRIGEWDAQPATAKIAAGINTKDTPQAKWTNMMDRAWTEAIDDRAPIKKAVEEFAAAGAPVETAANAYKLSRLLSGWSEKAMQFLEEGTFNANTLKTTGKPLREILLPLLKKNRPVNPAFDKLREDWGVEVAGDGLDDLRVYLVARRMQNYQSQGLETGFAKDEVKKAVEATKTPEIEKAANEIQEYQDAVLRYVVDRGGLSEAAYKDIKAKNSFYVPLYRVMDPTDTKIDVSAGGRKMININSPIRKRKGSVREVIDPLESIVKNTYAMISYADRNAVGQALVKQAERAQGKGSLLESGISAGTKVTKFNLKEVEPKIKEILKDADIDAEDVDFDALAAIYRPRTDPIGSKNQVAITVDGERQLFEMDPELKKAMDVTEYSTRHMLLKLLQAPANLLRFGATGAGPEFIIRNPLRDSFDAAMQSNNNFKPIIDTIWGGITMISNKEMVNEMVRAGGGGAGMMPIGRKALRRYLDEMLVAKPKYILRHPLEIFHVIEQAMRWAGDKTERMTRVGEYRLAKKKQKSPEDAAMDARDVSLDFSRMGSVARAINPYVAFFAPSLNGTARFFENHAKNPVRTATRGFAYITIPTIALWLLNKDDEDYTEIEPWKKNLFWLIPTKIFPNATELRKKVGPFIPIPRAHLYGLFYGNLVERTLDRAYQKNPEAFKGFGQDIISAMAPPIFPTGVAPEVEAVTNYSFFTGQNIENRTMETLLPQHRSTARTSDTAKAISNSLGQLGVDVSPAKIEHIFYGHTAGLGRAALLGAETAKRAITGETRNRPAASWAETPFLRAFSTPEVPNNPASVNKLYEEMDKLRKIRDSRKSAEKIPNGPAAGARAMTREERSMLGRLEQAARTLSGMNAQATKIQYDKTMSPEEKQAKLIRIQKDKVNRAARALGLKEVYK